MYKLSSEKILLFLVVLSIAALVFRGPLLEQRYVIGPGQMDGLRFELETDAQDGGNTQAEWIDKEQIEWRCLLGTAYEFRFCGMQIYFSDSYLVGKDLSNFTHLNIDLNYMGDSKSFRIFFRNSNPHYTKPNELRSTKFNSAELDTFKSVHEDVQLSNFRVADWWLQLYSLDMQFTQNEFNNIGLIEIQTGTAATASEHRFKLNKLELVGVHFSAEKLYFAIIVAWIVVIGLYLLLRIKSLRMAVSDGKKRQAELTEIYALLDHRHKTLERKSKLDPLTGAYNRAGIEESLKEAFHRWKRESSPLSLLLFDVDHFKRINDTKGHTVGDAVLRELTLLVSDNLRRSDRFARWGGEEFIVVCASTQLEMAHALAEKLRETIAQGAFSEGLQVTASFGVASIKEDESLEALFERCDQALYRAKAEGRNRVVLSS